LNRQANVGKQPIQDAENVAANVIDPLGGEPLVDHLPDVEVIFLPAQPKELRVVRRDVLAIRPFQRLNLPPKTAVQLEPEENRVTVRKLHR